MAVTKYVRQVAASSTGSRAVNPVRDARRSAPVRGYAPLRGRLGRAISVGKNFSSACREAAPVAPRPPA